MNSKKSYYDILGVSKNASKSELDSAFRKLAMKYHPDKYKGADAQDKMKEINKAYKVLSDPNQRKQYDAFLMSGHNTKDFDYQDSTSGFQQEEFGGRDFFQNSHLILVATILMVLISILKIFFQAFLVVILRILTLIILWRVK